MYIDSHQAGDSGHPGCTRCLGRARATFGLAALTTLAALVTTPAQAQETHTHSDGLTEHSHGRATESAHQSAHGLHFSHPIFTESISPDTKLRLDIARSWEKESNETELEWEGEYAFHRSFSIEAVVPYVFLDPDQADSESDLGNIDVALKFANFAFEEQGILLGYGVEVGIPTGNEDKQIGSDHIWELNPFLNIGVKRGRVEVQAFTIFGIPTNQDADEEIETEFKYDLSTLVHVSDRVQALLELNGQVGLSGAETGSGIVSLSPGIKVAPFANRAWFVGIGASFPLGEEELDASLRVATFYHF